jgi:hypothetical protein
VSASRAKAAGIDSRLIERRRSAETRIGRRRRRSTQTPAGRLRMTNGMNSIVVRSPNSSGETFRNSAATIGTARIVI